MTHSPLGQLPPRSILFVPADRQDMVAKAVTSGADAICLDLEDAVVRERKELARNNLEQSVRLIHNAGLQVLVRINADDADMSRDVDALVDFVNTIDALVIAKASGVEQIERLQQGLGDRGAAAAIIAMIEDINGLDSFAAIRPGELHSIAGITIGCEDLADQFECEPDSPAIEFAFYRLLECARRLAVPLYGFPGSIADFRDLDSFATRLGIGAKMGAVGAFCIHPRQVGVVNERFSPSEDEIENARAVIAAVDDAPTAGAFAVDGRMVDRPVVLRARRVMMRAMRINAVEKSDP
ncbi:MAG: CoA ester lyase [marine bacterium B5-7]|nr:MAG: CoA ester lyase [marine bacterium B5-7]